jgi:hypothetical protein
MPMAISFALAAAAGQAATVPSLAQDSAGTGSGIMIGGGATAVAHERCVDVEIAGSRSFNCLNLELKRQVDQTAPATAAAPFSAASPDISIGVVNVPAVQQQYGQNFGRSVFPYRPPPAIYTSPLMPHH